VTSNKTRRFSGHRGRPKTKNVNFNPAQIFDTKTYRLTVSRKVT